MSTGEGEVWPPTVDARQPPRYPHLLHAARVPLDPPTVLRTRDANGLFGASHVRWLVQSGRWQRPGKGLVVRHSGSLSFTEHVTCELLLQHPTAALGGLTAATLDGLRGFATTSTFIVTSHNTRARSRPHVVVVRSRQLSERDIQPVRAPRRTRLPRSIVDAASWASADLRCQAIIASSVQQGLVTPGALGAVAAGRMKLPRHALITQTIRDVGGGSLSEYEVLFFRMCRAYGLPTPTRQRRRKDASGRWRYLDVDFDEYQLVVEVDGQQHMEALTWWEDMMRNNELVVDEQKVLLRFAGFALRHQSQLVAAVLRRYFDTRAPTALR
jgi:very-short-patch-repair endonuclease